MKLNNNDSNEKTYELENNSNKKTLTESQVYDLMLPGGFTSMVVRMKVGDSLFHYDTMTEYISKK